MNKQPHTKVRFILSIAVEGQVLLLAVEVRVRAIVYFEQGELVYHPLEKY